MVVVISIRIFSVVFALLPYYCYYFRWLPTIFLPFAIKCASIHTMCVRTLASCGILVYHISNKLGIYFHPLMCTRRTHDGQCRLCLPTLWLVYMWGILCMPPMLLWSPNVFYGFQFTMKPHARTYIVRSLSWRLVSALCFCLAWMNVVHVL